MDANYDDNWATDDNYDDNGANDVNDLCDNDPYTGDYNNCLMTKIVAVMMKIVTVLWGWLFKRWWSLLRIIFKDTMIVADLKITAWWYLHIHDNVSDTVHCTVYMIIIEIICMIMLVVIWRRRFLCPIALKFL